MVLGLHAALALYRKSSLKVESSTVVTAVCFLFLCMADSVCMLALCIRLLISYYKVSLFSLAEVWEGEKKKPRSKQTNAKHGHCYGRQWSYRFLCIVVVEKSFVTCLKPGS